MSLNYHLHTHSHVKNQEKFDLLHSKKYVRMLDKMVLVVGILGPLFTIPQVWKIWVHHEVLGLSLFTWCSWLVFTFFWLAYGIAHKSKPLIVNNGIWVFLHLAVIIGIILFS